MTKTTPGAMRAAWKFEPMGVFLEYERVTGKKKADHEKYSRDNDGGWIIVDADGQRVATAAMRGKAKRGQSWCTPDPEGMANARLIAASPAMLEALQALMDEYKRRMDGDYPGENLHQFQSAYKMARAAISAATGEGKIG